MREDIKRVFDGIELSSEAKDTIFNRCIEKKHVRNIRIRHAPGPPARRRPAGPPRRRQAVLRRGSTPPGPHIRPRRPVPGTAPIPP